MLKRRPHDDRTHDFPQLFFLSTSVPAVAQSNAAATATGKVLLPLEKFQSKARYIRYRYERGGKRVSAKCKATRASKDSIVVHCVPVGLRACREGIRLALTRNCKQNLIKYIGISLCVSAEILLHVYAKACFCMISGTCVWAHIVK